MYAWRVRTGDSRVYSALLRHWRGRRGLSQLDLALAADVSARHISFLETGRAKPSRDMILRLAAALEVPLRDQNLMLDAAGFPSEFGSPSLEDGLPPAIVHAIERMLAQHEPYPMVVMDRKYDVLRVNDGAQRLLARMITDPDAVPSATNAFRMLFDPRLVRSFVVDWERVARALLSRLHRESLARPGDEELAALVRDLFEYPDVPETWRQPDFSIPSEPILSVGFRVGDFELRFMTMITVFNAPQKITLEDLRIESYFPMDDATTKALEELARAS